MGVYIPNMSKPKSCGECWALDDKYDYPMCLITQEQRGYDFNVMSKVMNDCPLIEIDLVRCGECKYYKGHEQYCEIDHFARENGFCSSGKRRE